MSFGIIADSCCDVDEALKQQLGVVIVPLKITVPGNPLFVDDENIDLPALWAAMAASKQPATTACPSPEEYAAAMRVYDECYVVTLSSKLSGSYNAAMVGRSMVLEESPEKKIHVFDSESATSGETRIVMEIREHIDAGVPFETIVEKVSTFVAGMRTLFVLEDLTNLMKNGRLGKIAGIAATVLGIRPVLSDNDHGEIIMVDKVRGTSAAVLRMVERAAAETRHRAANSLKVAISYCNCPERASGLVKLIRKNMPAASDITVIGARGLSSIYEGLGGIVMVY